MHINVTYRNINNSTVKNIISGTMKPSRTTLRASISLDKQIGKYKLLPNCLAR